MRTFNLDSEHEKETDLIDAQSPIPALPAIEATFKRGRIKPLTIEEYEQHFAEDASDLDLVERIYNGSMESNLLRRALWPYIFNLIEDKSRFVRDELGNYEIAESEKNVARWIELQDLYRLYENQWKAVMSDQEARFSIFRERKSLIERDVIRCDRLHPFYSDENQNLEKLTNLLMTYMMYDFDIGYVQGMSDLAGPILYAYDGDIIKSFWVFVEVMKLFRRNFELTQKTIHFQLGCLFKLLRVTDPIFANYLDQNDSSNCFFVFRAIVCQFKRELMKEDEGDYSKVLTLWDTIWAVNRKDELSEKSKKELDTKSTCSTGDSEPSSHHDQLTQQYTQFNITLADSPRNELTTIELFILSLCLSMIRRDRDIILAKMLDSTEIHLHFIDPKLAKDLDDFIEHAVNIFSYLKNDFDLKLLTAKQEQSSTGDQTSQEHPGNESPSVSEGYGLLSDYLIINAASGS